MNVKPRRLVRAGDSLAVTLPPDWLRGHGLKAGDPVELAYDEVVRVRPVQKHASDAGEKSPDVPAHRPARPVATDEGGLVDAER